MPTHDSTIEKNEAQEVEPQGKEEEDALGDDDDDNDVEDQNDINHGVVFEPRRSTRVRKSSLFL